MPRTPLGTISPKIVRNKELTPYTRGIIVGRSLAGETPTKIAADLQIPRRTIRTTLSATTKREEGVSKPRSGRPVCYTGREKRSILRLARSDPTLTHHQLKQLSHARCSHKTIYRILKDNEITNSVAKKSVSRQAGKAHLKPR